MCEEAMRVAVTGASSPFAYSLVYMLARGEVFGKTQPIILHLLDEPEKKEELEGIALELADCALPQVRQIIPTSDPTVAFIAVTCAFLSGPMTFKEGDDRQALVAGNLKMFKTFGQALNQYACKDVKVLILGVGANTNALVVSHYAPTIPRENFAAIARLNQNRAVTILSEKLRVPPSAISNVVVWGNNSPTVFPDAGTASVTHCGSTCCMYEAVNDEVYLQGPFIEEVQNREALVTEKRKQPPAVSAAKAACDQMRDWWFGTQPDQYTSMGVISDGSYCVPKDIFFAFPLEIADGQWNIVQGLPLEEFARSKMATSAKEIVEEKQQMAAACKAQSQSQATPSKAASQKDVAIKESKSAVKK